MTFLLIAGVAGWHYRVQLQDAYYAFIGEVDPNDPSVLMGSGEPSREALNSALRKQEEMARFDGPEFIPLSASEVASLIINGLDPIGRQALDSVKVTFRDDSFILDGQIVTEIWGREALGLLGTVLRPRESIRVAGPAW
ncbi:MAG: hypothetical protein OEZ54_12075, partial [Gemmatimonadota bacterium]|nr:hypothetical protein [Gemmatimonadota bacterium]